MSNLLTSAKFIRVENAAAAAQTELVTDIVDTQGYDSVMFLALLGDVTTAAVLTLTAKGNAANSTSGAAALAGAVTFTAGASDADNKMLILDIEKPRQRYVFASLTRTAANAVVDGIVAVLYNAENCPTVQDLTVLASSHTNDPAAA